eukprot:TRINITY_DN11264_c0_g1_i2.p1 TRINITY_DN11264_c0_g1~~TRINITY_DN11264_c0_g1_i2.p1  ORF type:complete len:1119 (-),score=205.36 TRINITY_DN11264_c0_g1_i2:16-3330(-)
MPSARGLQNPNGSGLLDTDGDSQDEEDEGSDTDDDTEHIRKYDPDGDGELLYTERLRRFYETRKCTPAVMLLLSSYIISSGLRFVLNEKSNHHLEEGAMDNGTGAQHRANIAFLIFLSQSSSFLLALGVSFSQEGVSFLRRTLSLSRFFHFGSVGILFFAAQGFWVLAFQASGSHLLAIVAGYLDMPLAAAISQWYFRRQYTFMQWLCFFMMAFAICAFMALRERYKECPVFSDIRCGSREAVKWQQSDWNWRPALFSIIATLFNVSASILNERLFHAWSFEPFYVLKVNMDFAGALTAAVAWLLTHKIEDYAWKVKYNSYTLVGEWHLLDFALFVVFISQSWASGLVVRTYSTVTKTVLAGISIICAVFIMDPSSHKTYHFLVRVVPSAMLVMIVLIAAVIYHTCIIYERQKKDALVDSSKSVLDNREEEEDVEHEGSDDEKGLSCNERCRSPWMGRFDRGQEQKVPDTTDEVDRPDSGAFDSQMLIISVVYVVTDTARTLLNSYALSSSQINPNSMTFLSFIVGLAFASFMTWKAHGLGCREDEEVDEQEISDEEKKRLRRTGSFSVVARKGLLQAWNFRKIVDYANSSFLQAVTMCLGNMAFAFGLNPAMSAVLGKVYTPVLALGERIFLKKRRKSIEWLAVSILTLGIFVFLYLQVYDVEDGLAEAMSDSLPIILCTLGACAAAFQALVSQRIYEENRDVDFYMNKVRFDAGSAFFSILVVPLLSLTASRSKDLVWLPRTTNADCNVDACWPKVKGLSSGGGIHWPWDNSGMDTCQAPTCSGVCECHAGLFAGWGLEPALYIFLAVTVFYGILVGIIYDKYGALHRAKCDAFGLLLTYWVGSPVLDYMTKGTSLRESWKDECMDIVSFIVPLAAISTDIGKIMTMEMIQTTCAFRMGLVSGLLSRVRGMEVGLLFSDPAKRGEPGGFQTPLFEDQIVLVDQPPANVSKKGAYVRVADGDPIDEDTHEEVQNLFNAISLHQKSTYKHFKKTLGGYDVEDATTRVALGVNSWAKNVHMVLAAKEGVRASAAGRRVELRSFGFQEIKESKESLQKAAQTQDHLALITRDDRYRNARDVLQKMAEELTTPEPECPYLQYVSEER